MSNDLKEGEQYILVSPGLYVKVDSTYLHHFLDMLHWQLNDVWIYKGGKFGCFVLINKLFLEVNPFNGQSRSNIHFNLSIFR